MSNVRSAARNSFASTSAQLANLAVGLISSIFIARILGRDPFGIYNWAVALSVMLMPVANAGIDNVIIRDMARKKSDARQYLLSSFLAKTITSSVCYGAIIAYLHIRGYTGAQLLVGYIQCSTIIAESFNYSCRATFVGLERQDVTAVISFITNLLRVALVILLIKSGYDVVAVAWVSLSAVLLSLAGHLMVFSRKVKGVWKPSAKVVKHLYAVGSTFLLSQIFAGLFDRVDIFMLEIFKGVGSVAVYGAAYRFIEIITIIGYNMSLALYPIMARKQNGSEEAYARMLRKSAKYVALIGLPLCVGLFMLSDKLMIGLYSDKFAAAGACLSILVWSRLGIFVVMPLQQAVAARNGQLMLVPPAIARAVINIGLNLYLIPRYGAIGACISMVITENVYYVLNYIIAFRGPERVNVLPLLLKPSLAVLIMAGAMVLLRPYNIFVGMFGGALAFVLAVKLIGVLDAEDKATLIKLVPASMRRRFGAEE